MSNCWLELLKCNICTSQPPSRACCVISPFGCNIFASQWLHCDLICLLDVLHQITLCRTNIRKCCWIVTGICSQKYLRIADYYPYFLCSFDLSVIFLQLLKLISVVVRENAFHFNQVFVNRWLSTGKFTHKCFKVVTDLFPKRHRLVHNGGFS